MYNRFDIPVPAGERKLRLFACACCRRIWHRLAPTSRRVVEAAEQYADAETRAAEAAAAARSAEQIERSGCVVRVSHEDVVQNPGVAEFSHYHCSERVHRLAAPAFTAADAREVADDLLPWRGDSIDNAEAEAAHDLIAADVFGPTPLPPFDPAWRTRRVVELARSIYDGRDFVRMPALADALEAAGCRNDDLLAHCRYGGEHVRGCWVLDLVLGLD
jgi:hypothetical protein